MGRINVGRWLLGGVVAGIVMWVLDGIGSMLYIADMQAAMERIGLPLNMSAAMWAWGAVVSLLVGLVLVFLYVAARPRFGARPRTAVVVAVVLYLGGYLPSLIGYHMLGLFPGRMLVLWGCIGLVELIVAGVLGAWIYREV